LAFGWGRGYCWGVVTDLAEVYRLGTAKAGENVAFRRYLSAHHHHSDTPFQIIATEVQKHVDCTTCANCCKHSIVTVNQREIEEIARHLGTTQEEVSRLYTGPDPDSARSRTLLSSDTGCVFLDGNLCMIYEARPTTCRNFPHISAGTRTLGSRPSSLARWAPWCPIIYNALEEYKHQTGFHSNSPSPQK
jgi:uncharacterized protein